MIKLMNDYKNTIERDLKLLEQRSLGYAAGVYSYDEFMSLREEIVSTLQLLEVACIRDLYNRVAKNPDKTNCYEYLNESGKIGSDYRKLFTELKQFIEANFKEEQMDRNIYEFVFYQYCRIDFLLNFNLHGLEN